MSRKQGTPQFSPNTMVVIPATEAGLRDDQDDNPDQRASSSSLSRRYHYQNQQSGDRDDAMGYYAHHGRETSGWNFIHKLCFVAVALCMCVAALTTLVFIAKNSQSLFSINIDTTSSDTPTQRGESRQIQAVRSMGSGGQAPSRVDVGSACMTPMHRHDHVYSISSAMRTLCRENVFNKTANEYSTHVMTLISMSIDICDQLNAQQDSDSCYLPRAVLLFESRLKCTFSTSGKRWPISV